MAEKGFKLPKGRKVLVYPVIHEGGMIPKGHSGTWQYANTTFSLMAPINPSTGNIVDVLTEDERKYFEDKSKYSEHGFNFDPGDLAAVNPNRSGKNYWETFEYVIRKPTDIVDESTVLDILDLGNGLDYLKYAVCRAFSGLFGPVAMGYDNRYDSPVKRIYLSDEGEKEIKLTALAQQKEDAYTHFKEIKGSKERMYEYMMIYWLENTGAPKPSFSSTNEWFIARISELIDNDPRRFNQVFDDNYQDKAFIFKCIKVGAVDYRGDGLFTKEGAYMGGSLKEAIMFINNPKHQDTLIKLKALVDNGLK